MTRFKWIHWNLSKIAVHGLSKAEVEFAFEHRAGRHVEREDGSYKTLGPTPGGRLILIIWRYNEEFDALAEDFVIQVVFVVTAY